MKYHLFLVNSALATIVALPLHAQVTVTSSTSQLTSTVTSTFDDFGSTYNTAVATVAGGQLGPGGSTPPTATTGNYLATSPGGTDITITFNGQASYFGLLWGSPDPNNTVTFYQGTTQEEVFTAAGIGTTLLPEYGSGIPATYVNFSANAPSDDFTSVVLSDGPGIPYFEVDNLAAVVAGTATAAPEMDPASVGSGLALLAGGLLVLRGRQEISMRASNAQ